MNIAMDPRTGRWMMTLDSFPPEKRREIEQIVAQPRPPKKWTRLGLCEIPSRAFYEWHAERGIDPFKKREPIPDYLRDAVVKRDRGVCGICESLVGPGDALHIDHIHPVALGGATVIGNLQVAHAACNLKKGAKV